MATEKEYREWQIRQRQYIKSRRRKQGINPLFWLFLVILPATIAIMDNPQWLLYLADRQNSLESLTRQFITETNEPILYYSGNDFRNTDFSSIDRIAQQITYTGNSTTELANLLSAHANNEVDKARLIYSWISHHIAYDVNALNNLFNNNIYPDVTTESVLTKKATICSGYANLYQQLATKMGLQSVIVLGYAKGGDYIVGIDNQVNHAWNALRVNGSWYLVDPTWGAGTVTNNKFNAKFNPFYFATNPQEFIYTHYPKEEKWQLLNTTYSRSQFDNLPDVSADLFKNQIKLISHQSGKIATDNRLTLSLQAPQNIVAIANLKSEQKSLEGNYTLVQRQGQNIMVNVAFPQQGKYELEIFAKPKDGKKFYPLVVRYNVLANGGTVEVPKTYHHFYENNGYLDSPLQGDLKDNQNSYFQLRIDNATDVRVVNRSTNKAQKLNRYGNLFTGNVNIRSGKVIVFAKFNNDSRYWALLEYE